MNCKSLCGNDLCGGGFFCWRNVVFHGGGDMSFWQVVGAVEL